MIEYVKGRVASLTPTAAVIDTPGGVGYLLNITLPTYTALQAKGGEDVRLLVHEVIRDDAWTLYGFVSEDERELFRALVAVSGVGAATARVILATIGTADLRGVIAQGDHRRLTAVKGVGAKTAQRIIVDLKDKIKAADATLIMTDNGSTGASAQVFDEALSAMVALGFPRPAAQKALRGIFQANPSTGVEAAIKQALAML